MTRLRLTMRDGSQVTHHEVEALALFAKTCHKDGIFWEPVRLLERGVWYDFADPATGKTGQCRMGSGWTWVQAPLGYEPVILRFLGDKP
jgi:hypothetical protein